jgi:type I restriction enzyme S subunit
MINGDLKKRISERAIDGIPEGWILTTIAEIAELNPPKPSQNALPPHTPVTFVPMPAVDAESGVISRPETRQFSEVRKGYTAFLEGDVIMAKITPCMENGKAAVVRDLENRLGFGSTEFHVLRSNGSVLPGYVYYFIRQQSFRKAAEAEMTGSVGQKRVPGEFLKQAEIQLPPFAEQKRIVTKIEKLLARVNFTKERLAKVSMILKRFRQAVLAAACSGRLTADWRENQNVLKEIGNIQDELSNMLPESWTRAKLSQVTKINMGQSPPGSSYNERGDGLPFFQGKADFGDRYPTVRVWCNEPKKIAQPGDVLITIRAPVGPTNVANKICAIGRGLAAISPKEGMTSEFILFVLRLKEPELALSGTGSTFTAIKRKDLEQIDINVPPITEQHEIVRRVESMFKLADAVEKRVAAATMRANKLTQAILAKAFRGELVPTEAELARRERRPYESASDLLVRIKSDRESKGPTKKARRNRN